MDEKTTLYFDKKRTFSILSATFRGKNMNAIDLYILRGKSLITISLTLLLISAGISLEKLEIKNYFYQTSYESVNIKSMATAKISLKKASNIKSTTSSSEQEKTSSQEFQTIQLQPVEQTIEVVEEMPVWQLPVETGVITTLPSTYHTALDIISTYGGTELIYPIANGTISGIYNDTAGAKIVTIHHIINGINYTSQYVHLSSYTEGLYVGKEVTVNDSIGWMGSTGYSTGIHLHLSVVDCALFDPTDSNCVDLNSFYHYLKLRYNQGFVGLQSLMNVPQSWTTRS